MFMHQLPLIVRCATPELGSQVKVLIKVLLIFQKKHEELVFKVEPFYRNRITCLFPEGFSDRTWGPCKGAGTESWPWLRG